MEQMYWYKIYNRDKSKCLGGVAANTPKEAVEKWYKAGKSKWSFVNAELYGCADKDRGMETYAN